MRHVSKRLTSNRGNRSSIPRREEAIGGEGSAWVRTVLAFERGRVFGRVLGASGGPSIFRELDKEGKKLRYDSAFKPTISSRGSPIL